jgi:hypothetical protein
VGLETLAGALEARGGEQAPSKFSSQAPTAIDGLREGYQALTSQLVEAGTNFVVMPEEEFQKYGAAGMTLICAFAYYDRLCNRNNEGSAFGLY